VRLPGHAHAGGGVCKRQGELLSTDRPWVLPIGTGPVILARNDVTRIRLRLADGSTRELTPHNNVAIGQGDNACSIEWQLADGSRHTAPVDGSPPERCGKQLARLRGMAGEALAACTTVATYQGNPHHPPARVLIPIGVFAGLVAYGALSNLWADYQDSSTSTYLLIGLPALAACVAALVGAVHVLRRW
jgi:hypothetical protein